jgi:hypothetical protein
VGALNVALVFMLLPRISRRQSLPAAMPLGLRLAVTALFGFGTVHWWLSSLGMVWYTAQVVALSFLLLTVSELLGRQRPFLVGVWFAGAVLTRAEILVGLPAVVWWLWPNVPFRRLLWMGVPLLAAALGMGWYNFARFHSPLDLGYNYMLIEKALLQRLEEHGSFSFRHLGRNLYWSLLALPELSAKWPYVHMPKMGLSVFVTTPALLLALAAPWRERLVRVSVAAVLLLAAPGLLYYNTGYMQAGYRFVLQYMPFLLILVTLGMRGRLRWFHTPLLATSVAMGYLSLQNMLWYLKY